MKEQKLVITWMVDSYGIESAHRNGPDMTMEQSFLGRLFHKQSSWYATVGKGEKAQELGPYTTMTQARNDLVKKIMENE